MEAEVAAALHEGRGRTGCRYAAFAAVSKRLSMRTEIKPYLRGFYETAVEVKVVFPFFYS
jgi:hypothetical protein